MTTKSGTCGQTWSYVTRSLAALLRWTLYVLIAGTATALLSAFLIARFQVRLGSNIELLGAYENIPDDPDINIFAPVLETISSGIAAEFSSVVLIFTESISTIVQQVRTLAMVPISPDVENQETANQIKVVYELEPEGQVVLEAAWRLYFESALRRARVEAAASEHAMRMISMGNANRNAGELIDDLTLELNATRQAAITQEVAEIIGGAEAIT